MPADTRYAILFTHAATLVAMLSYRSAPNFFIMDDILLIFNNITTKLPPTDGGLSRLPGQENFAIMAVSGCD
jgi:hypothetical protein